MALAIGKITQPYGISLLLACTIGKIKLSDSLMDFGIFYFFLYFNAISNYIAKDDTTVTKIICPRFIEVE